MLDVTADFGKVGQTSIPKLKSISTTAPSSELSLDVNSNKRQRSKSLELLSDNEARKKQVMSNYQREEPASADSTLARINSPQKVPATAGGESAIP